MFRKILIANRGEIAVRIIRACREMNIETVAIYSEADKDALHVKLADESVCIGAPAARDSYLNIFNILSATLLTGAEAIHPGFGLLAENSRFVDMCRKCGIAFIGPDVKSMELMGNKINARKTMIEAGVPVIPGSDGVLESVGDALRCAKKIGYPVVIKAVNGGGGRGIRKVMDSESLPAAYENAKAEAEASFGDCRLYMEKLISNARHVEVQVLADKYGNIVHLGERDCSIQRKNQKLIEESPCPVLTEELRQKMGEAAVRAARAVNYENAGTVEFLLDEEGNFYFMEMNTRIQVEHPVTEAVTGIDLIKAQINIAAGRKLPFTQKDIAIRGHAIECRINAEDPDRNFAPSCGTVNFLHIPGGPGVRFDTSLYQGYQIPPYYDSMLGKLIVHAASREEAIEKMRGALEELIIDGVTTNIDYQLAIINHEKFKKGLINTGFVEGMEK